ncbi:MAG TPA: hypothetical protein VGX50_02975 [Longimicrobium sp.]|jgi:hypothetical protein|nr:hypothetical protein [Longimicrobium sp.]
MNPRRYDQRIRLPQFRPGHLFWMGRGATWLNADKPRPFVLATTCGIGTLGTLIYGSTRDTEAHSGATCVHIDPRLGGVNQNGLAERTAFYPGILVRDRYERLPPHSGTVATSLAALRAALRDALGIGSGSCLAIGAPAGSLRGRIVRLGIRREAALHTPFAVILTQHAYSSARHYQLVLPLIPDRAGRVSPGVLRLSGHEWRAVFIQRPRSVLLPIPVVHSIWHEHDVRDETAYVLDEGSLAEIDRRLSEFFQLEAPEASG